MVAQAEALDRQGAQPEITPRRVQLRAAEHVDALAVCEVEPQGVESASGHRRGNHSPVHGILEREEDGVPAVLPT